ncbi:unnamed protein product [Rhizopus microsporus]|uniref:Pkinase-domain-containing protein n=1 Tax=Rhizopus microsporus TaxID=58291 RepID=A0A1X0S6E7_RHIZD|nr:Pkinase-domain-containing protein [Rhizopus microsporus]
MNAQRNNDEEEVKQFISDSLRIQLPEGSLQDILKDGIILCDLIRVFSPDGFIVKNEGKTKFAYQDNIGQFLREAERLHIPPSDLFQTVDLLEGKRMQSVITCLLAIQRIMRDRKLIPNTIRAKKKSNNMLFLKTEVKKRSSSLDLTKPSKDICKSKEGYVRSQVKSLSCQTITESPLPSPPHTRRNSSEALTKREEPKLLPTPPIPVATPSKSTPTSEQINSNNRKTSLKKMGACAIAVQNEDGTQSVYALGKSIGKGQFGEVFGGLNMDTGEYVAIKRIKRNQMDCDDMNEVGVLKHLNHEYIVRYKGFSKDKVYINIILEYVEMGSLLNNIKAFGKFPEKLAASYTYKILSGLHYLHSQQVIHCDLKAANILTTKTGGLKLTDFGVSLSLKMKDDETTGEPAGTPNWMAPEVIKLAGASTKSDIWSLGCTIVEMLTGKPPYAGMHSFAAMYKIVEDDEPPIPKNLNLSEEAREFLTSCFRKDPKDRPSAYDLMRYKWVEPFFKQDQQRSLKKSKSVNNLSCLHKRICEQYPSKAQMCSICFSMIGKNLRAKHCQDCGQTMHVFCIPSKLKSSTNKLYTALPPLSNEDECYIPLHSSKYKSEGYSQAKGIPDSRKSYNVVSSIMT